MQYEKWPTLCRNLKQTTQLRILIDIQDLIEELPHQLEEVTTLNKIIEDITQLLIQLRNHIDLDNMHIYTALEKSLSLFTQGPSHEILYVLEELLSKLAMSQLFLQQQVEEPINTIKCDGTSTCSDFSDDNFEVEDFEAGVAIDLFEQIKTQLSIQEQYDKCHEFHFIVCDKQINLQELFSECLNLDIKDYDLVIFLNYSGLLKRMINFKQNNQLEYFIQQLYGVFNKILQEDIEELVSTNCFELKYSRLSQRKFLRCNILSQLYIRIVQEKLDRWRQTQDIKEIQGQDLRELRRFVLEYKAPLSRWEVSILSIQEAEQYSNLLEKLQKLIIALEIPHQHLLENFIFLDKLYANRQQFHKWIKISNIPMTTKEVDELFSQISQVYGYYTLGGVKVVQRLNYYQFIDQVFGLQVPFSSDYKYHDEITLYQYNNHLQLKVATQQQQYLQLQQQQIKSELTQIEEQEQSQSRIKTQKNSDKENTLIKQDILEQNIVQNLKTEHQQEIQIIETKWRSKVKGLLFELENKDKQIEQYRIQLENIIKELDWVKTERH